MSLSLIEGNCCVIISISTIIRTIKLIWDIFCRNTIFDPIGGGCGGGGVGRAGNVLQPPHPMMTTNLLILMMKYCLVFQLC